MGIQLRFTFTLITKSYAIAYSVLHHLATHTRCLGMFSTHYIMLTDEFSQHPEVLLMHMASKIDPNNK